MKTAKPFLKWAGGKTQVLKHINKLIEHLDPKETTYYEPFLGAGSVFFSHNFRRSVINDLNDELINTYIQVRDNLEDVMSYLEEHKTNHTVNAKEYYYSIRELDRNSKFHQLSPAERAARNIYLNKTCFNGLYRVNSRGEFNTPIGKYFNPKILDKDNLLAVSKVLNKKKVIIKNEDFEKVVKRAQKGALIYFDPPYDYDHKNGFVSYHKDGFSKKELKRLRDLASDLIEKGCYVIISNHDTQRVRQLFSDNKFIMERIDDDDIEFVTKRINVNRSINAKGSARKHKVQEVLIYGSNLSTSR